MKWSRTSFLRIVLDALTKLRWPPSLEAFSDHINDLFYDNTVVINAYEFILKVGYPNTLTLMPSHQPMSNKSQQVSPEKPSCTEKCSTPIKVDTDRSHDNNALPSALEKLVFTPSIDLPNHRGRQPLSTPSSSFISSSEPANALTFSLKVFELLQYQNEMLTSQLAQLTSEIAQRDQAEAQLTAIIADLKAAVDEVVSISGNSLNNKDASSGGSEARRSLEKEAERGSEKKRTPPARPLASFVTPDKSSTVSEAEREAFLQEVQREEVRHSKPPMPPSRASPATDSLSGLWRRLQSRLEMLQAQWSEARKQARVSAAARSTHSALSDRSLSCSRPSDMLTRRLLGLSGVSCAAGGLMGEAEECAGLDLRRTHLLQRDLLGLCGSLAGWLEGAARPLDFPRSAEEAERVQQAALLQQRGSELLLHLSVLAPQSPLALPEHSQAALDLLGQALLNGAANATSSGHKQWTQQVQRLLDRAKAEQQGLVRCVLSRESLLGQWAAAAGRQAVRLEALGGDYGKLFDSAMAELRSLSEPLARLQAAVAEAESARPQPGGVSPFESICRGSHGKELASLLLALRMHRAELGQAVGSLQQLQQAVKSQLSRDLAGLRGQREGLQKATRFSEEVLVRGHTSADTAKPARAAPLPKRSSSSSSSSSSSLKSRPPFES